MVYWVDEFDVIVIGAGHAGCEAAYSSARLGARTALVTLNLDLIAQMSCNPAVGGIAKGHLVREIDALGGIQGLVADRTGIQFRLLNKRKGPSVRSPRTQSDRALYRHEMRKALESVENLHLLQAEVVAIHEKGQKIQGVKLHDGRSYKAKSVVITTGTFLNGLIHIGQLQIPAGRAGEPPSIELANNLRQLGYVMGRLKTGTPARIDGRTIDYSKMLTQEADDEPTFFSFLTYQQYLPQVKCHIVYTTEAVHKIIVSNLERSPLFSGKIVGIGPRYCPSIEDKVVKFPGKERHQLFVEPEGLNTHEVYLNGFSSSMPLDVQIEMLRALPGFEKSVMIRPAYAIEYDFIQPTELFQTLQSKKIEGLFHAGQINGTSGYEEAAAQGIVAGINAALFASGRDCVVIDRTSGYIGILISDLVNRGVDEPYRMFTSRAELRLLFRIDNADERLTPLGRKIGLVDDNRWESFNRKYSKIEEVRRWVKEKTINPTEPGIESLSDDVKRKIKDHRQVKKLVKMPEIRLRDMKQFLENDGIKVYDDLLDQVENDFKYEGYIELQRKELARLEKMKNRTIPPNFDYDKIPSLSHEMRERLKKSSPKTLADVEQIRGITPIVLSILNIHIELMKKSRNVKKGKRERKNGKNHR